MRYLPVLSGLVGLIAAVGEVSGQQVLENGCLRLLGSVACPGCESISLVPQHPSPSDAVHELS